MVSVCGGLQRTTRQRPIGKDDRGIGVKDIGSRAGQILMIKV